MLPKCFPEDWRRALIIPIQKGRVCERSNLNTYRGISSLTCVGKLFTKSINNRLTEWSEDNDSVSEVQAGFTKGKSMIDKMFIFQSIITNYLSKRKGRFYNIYVDLSKAFDSVAHLQLFYSVLQ